MRVKKDRGRRFTHILPPCRVCGARGTGFHYGANTCGACKGFFRRALVRSELYECTQSPLCSAGPYTSRKLTCPRCRYDKCIAVGMSKDACKVGRYTLIKRFKDTQEAMKYHRSEPNTPRTNADEAATERLQNSSQAMSELSTTSGSNMDTSSGHDESSDSSQNMNCSTSQPTLSTPFFSTEGTVLKNETPSNQNPLPTSDKPPITFPPVLSLSKFERAFLHNINSNGTLVNNQLPPVSPDSSNIVIDSIGKSFFDNVIKLDSPTTKPVERLHKNQHSSSLSESHVQCSSCKTKGFSRVLNKHVPEQNRIKICMVSPDPMKYNLSMFDEFPFTSFEKKNISRLLKMCYDCNEWVDNYLSQKRFQTKRSWCKDFKIQEVSSTSTIRPAHVLFSGHSHEVIMSEQDLTYDATEMDNLYDNLEEVHCRHYGPKSSFLSGSEVRQCLQMFSKICELHDSLKGKLNLIDDEKYYTILSSTGVDVDNRREWFNALFATYDEFFARDMKYVRALPGFKRLPLNARMKLTKTTYMNMIKLRQHNTTSYEEDIFLDQENGFGSRISMMTRILPGNLFDEWLPITQTLKSMHLSHKEMVILKPVFLFMPGLDEDEISKQVLTSLHSTYLKCYLNHVRKHYGPAGDDRFNKMIGIIHDVKGMNAIYEKARRQLADTVSKLADSERDVLMLEVICKP